MFGETFIRDFFGMGSGGSYTSLSWSFSREIVDKALELAKGQPPEANLMPYINLVCDASRLGCEVTKAKK